ncbi:DUF4961 domain-containing protein [Olivibacter sp. CPCC 100613]|uniref:DUF4961 domain-containing protein n=1 Tax=Olivibacter sp. CPCC 100613 TaxID=3079931 RepID=UPI002FF68D89
MNYLVMKRLVRRKYQLTLWSLFSLAIVSCVFLDGVEQASGVKAGEIFKATLRAHVNAAQERNNVRFVIAVLVPRSWKASENMQISYSAKDFGSGDMVPVPASVRAPNSDNNAVWPTALKNKFGIGPNLIDDMEWVVFWTGKQYNIKGGDNPVIEAQIQIKSGMQNMKFKFGYFVGSSEDGLNDFLGGPGALYKTLFSDCFEVTDGEGDVQDFCNPPQTFFDPYRATDNDILTLTYDRDILPGPLGDEIYLCATAQLKDGSTITSCEPLEEHRLTPVEGAAGRFEITFWPRAYFGLSKEQAIDQIHYYFTDLSGEIKIGYGNTDEPFVYSFQCD